MKLISVLLFIFMVIFLITGCERAVSPRESKITVHSGGNEISPAVDSVSAASDTIFFAENTLSVEELYETIHNLSGGALAVSTVNADGSPNLAYVGPDMVDDDVLMFGLSDNQTRINIQKRKLAVAGVYLYESDWEGGLSDSRGARLVLRLIEDEEEIELLRKRAPEAPEDVLFMRIVRILPVG